MFISEKKIKEYIDQRLNELFDGRHAGIINRFHTSIKTQVDQYYSDKIQKEVEQVFRDYGERVVETFFKSAMDKYPTMMVHIFEKVVQREFKEQLTERSKEYFESEEFIDDVVQRIKRKQLNG